MRKRSPYRIVPGENDKYGKVWFIKEGDIVLHTFITKLHAEKTKAHLDKILQENYLIEKTSNQELDLKNL
jgi:hypothetical protein